MAGNQGLSQNSDMSQEDRNRVHSEGGKASHGSGSTQSSSTNNGNAITNKSGGGRLTKEDQRRGGQASGSN